MRKALLFVLVGLVLCFLYIWPGVWRYRYSGGAVRTDKLTGHRYIYNPPEQRWRDEAMMLEHIKREQEFDRTIRAVEKEIERLMDDRY